MRARTGLDISAAFSCSRDLRNEDFLVKYHTVMCRAPLYSSFRRSRLVYVVHCGNLTQGPKNETSVDLSARNDWCLSGLRALPVVLLVHSSSSFVCFPSDVCLEVGVCQCCREVTS
jgi:hypothetical protein